MTTAKQFTCPTCGWSITDPSGTEELMKFVQMHKDMKHPDMKATKDQIMAMVKDVEIGLPGHPPMDKDSILSDLKKIPGMNELTAQALYIYGIHSVDELIGKNADEVYLEMSKRHDVPADTCFLLLNGLRTAVTYANTMVTKKR
ncbi:MAG TPA: helix-hairpin-helix domain-containing protein [Methanomassiliicoccales archaeon]|jgi:predicted small metal-binding protein